MDKTKYGVKNFVDYSIFNQDINFSFGTNIINYLIINSMPNESRYIAG
jgi:hypothetical protein